MAIPPCGTFKYFVIVPGDLHYQASPWPVQLGERVPFFGDSLLTSRLVGLSPRLYLTDSSTSPPRGLDSPAVEMTRLRLVARSKRRATVPEASFLIAKGLFLTLRHGDVLHMSRTDCGGTGLSAIRGGRLVFAVGAIHAVPLGEDISVRYPNMSQSMEWFFQKTNHDPELRRLVVEVTVGARTFTAYEGRSQLGEYEVSIVHGYRLGFPGDDECVSIARTDACSPKEAEISARLLDHLDTKMLRL